MLLSMFLNILGDCDSGRKSDPRLVGQMAQPGFLGWVVEQYEPKVANSSLQLVLGLERERTKKKKKKIKERGNQKSTLFSLAERGNQKSTLFSLAEQEGNEPGCEAWVYRSLSFVTCLCAAAYL